MSDPRLLTAEDLLAGTATVHEVAVPRSRAAPPRVSRAARGTR